MAFPEPPLPPSAAAPGAAAKGGGGLRSLRLRLILLVLMALAPLLVLSLYQLWEAHRLRTAAAHLQAAALADGLNQHHAALLHTAGRTLRALAAMPAVTSGAVGSCAPILATVVGQDNTFVNMVRSTADGRIDCAATVNFALLPPAANAALMQALASGRMAVGEVHLSNAHRLPIMPIALPLPAGRDTGSDGGALVGAVRLTWFDILGRMPRGLPPRTVILLTDPRGTIIDTVPPHPELVGTLARQPTAPGRPEVWSGLYEGDGPRVVASALTEDGLRIIVGIAREEVDAAIRNDLLMALGVSLAALLMALVAGHGISRFLVLHPLQPLRRATARMARGDFSGRIGPPYRGPAELVDLAQAFDTMADRIAERELELINSETKLLVKRQSEERYRTLVERAPEAIVVVVGDVVAFANGRAAEIFGTPEVQTLIGTPLDLLMEPNDPLRALLEEPPGEAEPPRLHECLLHRLQHGTFWAEVALAPVDYAGRPAWHVVVRDVTDRKEVERQLAQASKLATLGEVAAGLAHELSQPMNVIRVAAEAATMEDAGALLPASTREHLALIADQAARMGEIIDHVRVFSRPEPGQRARFNAYAAARRATAFLDQQIRDDGIALDLWFDGDHATVDGVPVHVEQVMLDLLANARASVRRVALAPQGGWRPRITLTGRMIDEDVPGAARVLLSVWDNAGAVDDEVLRHAFDPFFSRRTDGAAPGIGGGGAVGGGLGLSICYALAAAMGGTLTVRNEGIGTEAGRVFTLALPAEPRCAQHQPTAQAIEA
ncbi:PAS domain S-box protein [Novispirillum sp. DQ9]|uniref:PAS domain S-box protein n=1 Tax=Novispirillum sp. DQ9 TaxID=3398612 RepID=UPI003C7D4007